MRIVDVDNTIKKIETKKKETSITDEYTYGMVEGLDLALQILRDDVAEVKRSKRGAFITYYIPLDDREDEEK